MWKRCLLLLTCAFALLAIEGCAAARLASLASKAGSAAKVGAAGAKAAAVATKAGVKATAVAAKAGATAKVGAAATTAKAAAVATKAGAVATLNTAAHAAEASSGAAVAGLRVCQVGRVAAAAAQVSSHPGGPGQTVLAQHSFGLPAQAQLRAELISREQAKVLRLHLDGGLRSARVRSLRPAIGDWIGLGRASDGSLVSPALELARGPVSLEMLVSAQSPEVGDHRLRWDLTIASP